jgi:phage gp29-like protein
MIRLPRWREYYNPLHGLTMARLVSMEDAADRGQHADVQWLYRHMETADVTVQAAIARRLAFLDTLAWEVRTTEGADPALAQEQGELLRYAYNGIDNLRDATRALAMAAFRGFAILDKVEGADGRIERLDPIEQWFWIRPAGEAWQLNRDTLAYCGKGDPVEQDRLVVMEAMSANRSIARAFFAKTLAQADWDQALETSANPSIFFIAPEGTDEDTLAQYQAIAEKIASNGRGVLPSGTEVKTVDTAQRGRVPYAERIDYCDRQIVMAATGGILTMLSAPGSGTLAGGAHAQTLLDLARSDAGRLSEAYQRHIDAPLLDRYFPDQPHVAFFEFDVPQVENTAQLLEAAANLNWAGYRVDQKQLEEKTGLKLVPIPTGPPA